MTAGDWVVETTGITHRIVRNDPDVPDVVVVAECGFDLDNALHIVKCKENHEPLLEALEALLRRTDEYQCPDYYKYKRLVEEAR